MAKIIGGNIPNFPWQDKPEGYKYPVWRYDGNPVITRDNLYGANSIFNSAVVPFKDGFAGVFRVDDISRDHTIVVGYSKDAINWDLEEKVIFRGYDPRLCEIDGKYYLSWVNLTPHGTTIGIAYTTDFKEWTQLEDACYPVARNGVLFPRKVNDEYLLLIRPCDSRLLLRGIVVSRHKGGNGDVDKSVAVYVLAAHGGNGSVKAFKYAYILSLELVDYRVFGVYGGNKGGHLAVARLKVGKHRRKSRGKFSEGQLLISRHRSRQLDLTGLYYSARSELCHRHDGVSRPVSGAKKQLVQSVFINVLYKYLVIFGFIA